MVERKAEMRLRGLAIALGAAWLLGMILMASGGSRPPAIVPILAALLWVGAYVGGPIVGYRLSSQLGLMYGCGLALLSFIAPVITLPILGLWRINTIPPARTAHLRESGDLAGLAAALRDHRAAYAPANAARTLAQVGSAQAAQLLAAALHDPDSRARAAGADGLAQLALFQGEAALSAPGVAQLIANLQDYDAEVRAASARALGFIGECSAAPLIAALRSDADPYVARTAAKALRPTGSARRGRGGAATHAACHGWNAPGPRRCPARARGYGRRRSPAQLQRRP